MASVSQLGYLGLSVRDLNQWEQFAAQVLGLQPNGHDPDGALFLRMDDYHHRFIVHPTGNDDLAYIGWETHSRRGRADEQVLLLDFLVAQEIAAEKSLDQLSLRRLRYDNPSR